MALNSARLKTFLNVPRDLREWTRYIQQALESFISTLTTSDLTDASAAGAALVTAADVGAQRTVLGLASGTYTPTLTNVTNLSASTAYACQYLKVGGTVTVSGRVDIDPTATGAAELGISLPVTADIGALEACAGTAFASGIAGQGAAIVGDATNDRASMRWVASDVTNQAMYFCFAYQVSDTVTGSTVTYTTGTVTETVPAGKTSVVIRVWGGGGAGGGAIYSGYFSSSGGGGGGGAYSSKTIAVTAGDTFSVTVAAQVSGVKGSSGPDGNASTVTGTVSGGSVAMTANGGAGGQLFGTGGAGGSASGGDTDTSGASGSAGGGAGGAAGNGGSGGTANGGAGAVPGGGGGGVASSSATLPGGTGARGQVSFTYT